MVPFIVAYFAALVKTAGGFPPQGEKNREFNQKIFKFLLTII